MRAYVVVSGCIFALVVAAHVARLVVEGTGPLHDVAFVVSTLLAAVLAGWAALAARR